MNPRYAKVVGLRFRPESDRAVAASIVEGDKVMLIPEPTNQHDTNAIRVVFARPSGETAHIGYIERVIAASLSPWLQAQPSIVWATIHMRSAAAFLIINPMHESALPASAGE